MRLQRISDEKVFEVYSTERDECKTWVLIYEDGWHWCMIGDFVPYVEYL